MPPKRPIISFLQTDSIRETSNVKRDRDGLRQGFGTIEIEGRYRYEGNFVNDKFEGENCILTNFDTLELYEGSFLGGEKHGKGKLRDKDMSFYEGDFKKNKKSGFGREYFTNGDYYVGNYSDDRPHGEGAYETFNKNYRYEGEFFEGKLHGNGKESFFDKEAIFEGEFKMGRREGYGLYLIKAPMSPELIVELHCLPFIKELKEEEKNHQSSLERDKLLHNFGYCVSSVNEYEYNGEWKNGVKSGYGVEKFRVIIKTRADQGNEKESSIPPENEKKKEQMGESNGVIIYEGEFQNGARNGLGRMTVVGRNTIYGTWVLGKKNGTFVEYDERGNQTNQVIYVHNERISEKALRSLGLPNSYEDGHYRNILASLAEGRRRSFTDDQFEKNMELRISFLELIASKSLRKVTPGEIEMVRISQLLPESFKEREEDWLHGIGFGPRMPYFKYDYKGDQAFLLFITRFFSLFPQGMGTLLHPYTNIDAGIFSVFMYKYTEGISQKFGMVVDDLIPLDSTQQPLFHFDQKRFHQTLFISLFEKIWFKYILLEKINVQSEFNHISQMIFAFLGVPTLRQKIDADFSDFWNKHKDLPMKFVTMKAKKAAEKAIAPEMLFELLVFSDSEDKDFVILRTNLIGLPNLGQIEQQENFYSLVGEFKIVNRDGLIGFRTHNFLEMFEEAFVAVYEKNSIVSSIPLIPKEEKRVRFTNHFFEFQITVPMPVYLCIEQLSTEKETVEEGGKEKNSEYHYPLRMILAMYKRGKSLKEEGHIRHQRRVRERKKYEEEKQRNPHANQPVLRLVAGNEESESLSHSQAPGAHNSPRKPDLNKSSLVGLVFHKKTMDSRFKVEEKKSKVEKKEPLSPSHNSPTTPKHEAPKTMTESLVYENKKTDALNNLIQLDSESFAKEMKRLCEPKLVRFYGKGQSREKFLVSDRLMLKPGRYVWCLQVQEYKRPFNLISSIFNFSIVSSMFPVSIRPFPQISNFLRTVYSNAVQKSSSVFYVRRNEVRDKKMQIYEDFYKEEGVFVRLFKNDTDDIVWHQRVSITTQNMELNRYPGIKLFPDLEIKPREQAVVIFQQINGEGYVFDSAKGVCQTETLNEALEKKRKPAKHKFLIRSGVATSMAPDY